MRSAIAALTAAALWAVPGPPQGAASPAAWVQDYRDAVSRAGIVGSRLLVMKNGQSLVNEGVGLQDRSANAPVTDDTIFHWASITKTFTGIAIMQLRDRGLLSLDDPVVKFVPELRLAHNPFGPVEQVRIRHLMSHSGGFRASTWPWGGDKPWHPFEPTTWQQLVAMLPYTDVQFEPGSKYSYSNPGVIFLGRIIETLSGDDYETYITKNIFMPLGMHRAFFDRAPYHLLPFRSHSYFRDDGGTREARFDFDTGITVSNGGLNAPFGDMAKYLAFLLGDPSRTREYDGVLKRSSLEEMWTPQVRALEGEGTNGSDSSAALSFFVEKYGSTTLIGHSGDQNGFISHLYLHPPTRTAWIVNFNTDVTPAADGSRQGSRQVDTLVRDRILANVIHGK
jgi:CubicO group peptidase (beta-lactamase class C family)